MELPNIQKPKRSNRSFTSERIRDSYTRSAKKFLNKTLTTADITFNKNSNLTKEYYKALLEKMEFEQVSNNLLNVKKQHDGHINQFDLREQEFKTINAKLNSLTYCERKTQDFQKESEVQIEKLVQQLEQMQIQQALTYDQQQRYKNMLSRLKEERNF